MVGQRGNAPELLAAEERKVLYEVGKPQAPQWRSYRKADTMLKRGFKATNFVARGVDFSVATHRIKHLVEAYGRCRVVTSFGAADGGSIFVIWLRDKIMSAKGWHEPNAVYVDFFALEHVPGTKADTEYLRALDGTQRKSGRPTSRNEGWAEYYRYAMGMADCMIFLFTAAWFKSAWCGRELNYFIKENEQRAHDGVPPLKGIGLSFTEEGAPPSAPGLTMIPAKKEYLVANKSCRAKLESAYADAFIVDDATLQRVMAAIG